MLKDDLTSNQVAPGDENDPWKKDPWKKQQGPPDLDQILNQLLKKFRAGRKGGSSSNGSGGSGGKRTPQVTLPGGFSLSTMVIVGLLVIWLVRGFYTVEQSENAVVLRFGEYLKTQTAGLHWHLPYPIEKVEIVDVRKINTVEVGYRSQGGRQTGSITRESLMLTQDENIIDVQFAVQYDIKDPRDLLFNVSDGTETLVRQATESAVREVVGSNTMDFAITEGRAQIASRTQALLQSILDRYESGINVLAVEMQNAQPPAEVKAAFDDAVKAREDQERLKNEAEAYANDVIPKARGQAARVIEEARGYEVSIVEDARGAASRFEQVLKEYRAAPKVTRDRLYLETLESVFANTSKVLIDSENSNSLFYLPLDQLLKQGTGSRENFSRQDNRAGTAGNSSLNERSNTGVRNGRTR